ncbi:MAG TPA: carboxypeptidase-like regulatory domain-containing protein [Gaiellaceae bacterium]|nr:carboxypeptidase-like regulatory domain-containing protein [Gaiellaceae bacterium]
MLANPVAALPIALLSLLHGTVTIGPVTPVCRVGVPCDKPAASVVLTFTRGARVFRTKTHADGAYTLRLPPGAYTVRSSEGMRISPLQVTARKGSHLQGFSIDTGIR